MPSVKFNEVNAISISQNQRYSQEFSRIKVPAQLRIGLNQQ